ncbi:hypothetical protein EOM89_13925 [Candidatus Falkowbacteria bacterium]|nr:hypothetical protein [Candidatus Falkowbacteria bacterium]
MNLQAFASTPAISPSIISVCDPLRMLDSVRALEAADVPMLHIDLLDGSFSPSMPLGLDTVRALRGATALALDCHIMAVRNEFFIRELLAIGVEQIVFHIETEPHVDYWLNEIHAAGVRAGVALKPATPLCSLDYVLEKCDVVELMLINPGYASSARDNAPGAILFYRLACRPYLPQSSRATATGSPEGVAGRGSVCRVQAASHSWSSRVRASASKGVPPSMEARRAPKNFSQRGV